MKILFIGESWVIHMIHTKGFDSFTSTKYEEGATYLLEVLRKRNIDIDYMPSHEVQVRFPKDKEILSSYDAIVISDIGANTFLMQNKSFYDKHTVPNALDNIKNFVFEGGGLLMIGGYLSFTGIEAKANYQNTVLSEVLPVKMLSHDDRVEKPEGFQPKAEKENNIFSDFGEWPTFLGYNRFITKPEAKTLLSFEGDPILSVGEFGKGTTAAFASDCAPHWGSEEFLNWNYYSEFWSQLLNYISQKD